MLQATVRGKPLLCNKYLPLTPGAKRERVAEIPGRVKEQVVIPPGGTEKINY